MGPLTLHYLDGVFRIYLGKFVIIIAYLHSRTVYRDYIAIGMMFNHPFVSRTQICF